MLRSRLEPVSLVLLVSACAAGAPRSNTVEPATVSSVVVPAQPPPDASTVGMADDEEEAPIAQPAPDPRSNPSEDDLAAARELFKEGVMAFEQADYATARDRFKSAYELVPKAPVLYNLAKAEQQLGNQAKACEYLAAWVRDRTIHPAQLQNAAADLRKCGINP